jgi:cell wall-associated NlpC family hydrolase
MIGWLLAMTLVAQPAAVVLKPVANMYSKPTREADVVSQALYGTTVGLVEEENGWARVRTPDDYTGWMPLEWLRRLGPDEPLYASQGPVAQVESLFANLYREPDVTRREPLMTLPYEVRLEIAAEPEPGGRWLRVRLVDGSEAWIQRGDLRLDFRPASVEEVLLFARRFLGLPYLWGGTSAFGYDCSGFVQMLCRRRGVLIPRDAHPQCHWEGMSPVEREDLKPGDLLCFGKSLDKITHIGIYLGNGEFINATTYQQPVVRLDRLDDPHWQKLFVAARRLK